jgi:hypothetical protein
MATGWYFNKNGQPYGPVSDPQMKQLVASGQVTRQDLVWQEGFPAWVPAHTASGLFPPGAAPPQGREENVSSPPVPGIPDGQNWLEAIQLHGQRALSWDLRQLRVSAREQENLSRRGLTEPQLQQYLAWRRSMLLVAFAPTMLIAFLNTADQLGGDYSALSHLGRLWLALNIFLPYAMPGTILAAALLSWDQKLSWRIIVYGWAISFLGPILLLLVPAHWLFNVVDSSEALGARFGFGIYVFVGQCLSLPVYIVSVAFGVQRACLRLKTLLPVSPVPGLFLAAAAPVFPLVLLPFFLLVNQVASSPFLILGMLLVMCSPLLYLARAGLFVRPLLQAEDFRQVYITQWLVRGTFGLGVTLLLTYAMTRTWLVPRTGGWEELLSGFDRKTLLGFTSDTSVWRPWDWHLIRWLVIEPLGRSLFTTLLVADLFVRVHRSVWGYSRQMATSPDAAKYDRLANMLP